KDDYHRADDPKRDEVVRMVPRLDPLLRTESLLEAHRAHLQLQGLETLMRGNVAYVREEILVALNSEAEDQPRDDDHHVANKGQRMRRDSLQCRQEGRRSCGHRLLRTELFIRRSQRNR